MYSCLSICAQCICDIYPSKYLTIYKVIYRYRYLSFILNAASTYIELFIRACVCVIIQATNIQMMQILTQSKITELYHAEWYVQKRYEKTVK
jgi:hypothetical protein